MDEVLAPLEKDEAGEPFDRDIGGSCDSESSEPAVIVDTSLGGRKCLPSEGSILRGPPVGIGAVAFSCASVDARAAAADSCRTTSVGAVAGAETTPSSFGVAWGADCSAPMLETEA